MIFHSLSWAHNKPFQKGYISFSLEVISYSFLRCFPSFNFFHYYFLGFLIAVWSFWICPLGLLSFLWFPFVTLLLSIFFQVLFIYFRLSWDFTAECRLSPVAVSRGCSSCSVRASHCGGFSCCGSYALGLVGFSNCSTWAQWRPSMWNLPRPGRTCVPCGPLDHLALLFLEIFSPHNSMF